MPYEYDGRSMVPDLTNALALAFGVAQQKRADRKEAAGEKELDALDAQLDANGKVAAASGKPVSQMEFLARPENKKILSRMGRINPQAAQMALVLAKTADENSLKRLGDESARASSTFQAIIDTKDQAERNRLIVTEIRGREERGEDTSKLRELIGQPFDKQTLRARQNVILAGDFKLLADNGLQAMKDALEIANLRLTGIDKARDIERKSREDATGKESDVAGMRKEYTGLSAPFITVRDAYSRVRESASNPSPAGDLALIMNYAKILDPGARVTEQDFQAAANTGSFGDQIKAAAAKVYRGERLTPEQRADFLGRAQSMYRSQKAAHGALRSQYGTLAQQRGFRPDDVAIDFSMPELDQPMPGTDEALPRPVNKADYDALPAGAVYMAPDGKKRRKR